MIFMILSSETLGNWRSSMGRMKNSLLKNIMAGEERPAEYRRLTMEDLASQI